MGTAQGLSKACGHAPAAVFQYQLFAGLRRFLRGLPPADIALQRLGQTRLARIWGWRLLRTHSESTFGGRKLD